MTRFALQWHRLTWKQTVVFKDSLFKLQYLPALWQLAKHQPGMLKPRLHVQHRVNPVKPKKERPMIKLVNVSPQRDIEKQKKATSTGMSRTF